MSTTTANQSNATSAGRMLHVDESSMRTNKVEQVSSLLISVALMLALAVGMLFLLFLLSMNWTRQQKMGIEAEKLAGRGENAAGFDRDFDPPSADEVEQLTEPALEQTIQMVNDAIAAISSMDTIMASDAITGDRSGQGDSRPPGPEGEGVDGVQRGERWELKFSARDRKAYASQLDTFGIELAAIGGGIATIDYATTLAKSPKGRSGNRDQEKRLFFSYVTNNALMQYDKALLQSAGVNIKDRSVLKFVPKDLEDILAIAEKSFYLEKRSKDFRVSDIAKTIFECKGTKSGKFEWVVIDQRYRNKNPSVK
ncbi:MAG: hypothetical protein NTV29_08670 [Planctomycetota bacterium]|nr:hypothetical protein [Planctomycetota bacterium]